jgi:hypothetical protein
MQAQVRDRRDAALDGALLAAELRPVRVHDDGPRVAAARDRGGDRGDRGLRRAAVHEQLVAASLQRRVEIGHGLGEKRRALALDAREARLPRRRRAGAEAQARIEHEQMHDAGGLVRGEERRMVVQAQVRGLEEDHVGGFEGCHRVARFRKARNDDQRPSRLTPRRDAHYAPRDRGPRTPPTWS